MYWERRSPGTCKVAVVPTAPIWLVAVHVYVPASSGTTQKRWVRGQSFFLHKNLYLDKLEEQSVDKLHSCSRSRGCSSSRGSSRSLTTKLRVISLIGRCTRILLSDRSLQQYHGAATNKNTGTLKYVIEALITVMNTGALFGWPSFWLGGGTPGVPGELVGVSIRPETNWNETLGEYQVSNT